MTVKELIELLSKEKPEATVRKTSYESNDSGTSWEVDWDINYLTSHTDEKQKPIVHIH